MKQNRLFRYFLILSCLTFSISISAEAEPAEIYYFYASSCGHCRAIAEELLIPLKKKQPDISVRYLETGETENYSLLIDTEALLAPESPKQIPVLVSGNTIYSGEESIRTAFDSIIGNIISHEISPLPDELKFKERAHAQDKPRFDDTTDETNCSDDACARDTIWMAYFYQTGCRNCSRAEADIRYIRQRYPQIELRKFNVYDHAPLARFMAERASLGENFETPAIFVGDDELIGEDAITPASIEALAKKYPRGAPQFWNSASREKNEHAIVESFSKLGILTIFAAGLIDGLNPCAFATILFFVSYLTLARRKGREILLVGSSFSLGVFLAYLAVGFGFYKILDFTGSLLSALGRWVYGITALCCLIFAVLSFHDFLKARKGALNEMTLTLPDFLRSRINESIRKGRRAKHFIIQAFCSGIVISFLELACTGQIYLPTLIYVQSIPGLRVRSALYLLIYNIAFVLPLIAVFILAWYGTSSQHFQDFFVKRSAALKLAMSILFLCLGTWLASAVVL